MRSVAIQRVSDLTAPEKEALERLLGRPLHQSEEISIRSYPRDLLPDSAASRCAAEALDELLAQRLEQIKDVPEAELDRAAEEAIRFVRQSDSGTA